LYILKAVLKDNFDNFNDCLMDYFHDDTDDLYAFYFVNFAINENLTYLLILNEVIYYSIFILFCYDYDDNLIQHYFKLISFINY